MTRLTFWRDLKKRELFPIKLLLFLQAIGDMALYPFLTLHMKYLGITVAEIGIQFAVSPLATLIATPLVGLLADKIGNFKVLLSISLVFCAGVSNLLLLVPAVKMIPDSTFLRFQATFACPVDGSSLLNISVPEKIYSKIISETNSTIKLSSRSQNSTSEASGDEGSLDESMILKNCNIYCDSKGAGLLDVKNFTKSLKLCIYEYQDHQCREFGKNETDSITIRLGDLMNSSAVSTFSVTKIYVKNKTFHMISCDSELPSKNQNNYSCRVQCSVNSSFLYSDRVPLVPDAKSKAVTFWYYLVLRVLLIICIATEISLLKAAILTIIDEYKTEYGFQRVWVSVANCISPPITGVVMDYLQRGSVEDYRPCFFTYGSMKILMAALTLFMNLTVKAPSMQLLSNIRRLLKNPETTILLLYCAFIGSAWGFLETFLLWYLESLGASKTLMGMTFTVGSLCGIPTTLLAGFLSRKFGFAPLISLGLFAYSVRFVGYSYIPTPYHALIFEALESFTFALMIVILTTYSSILATSELVATMQATWGAIHFAVGRALGSVIGGFMIDSLGSRTTYQLYAAFCLFMGVLYLLLYYLWLSKRDGAMATSGKEDKVRNGSDNKEIENDKRPAIEMSSPLEKLRVASPTDIEIDNIILEDETVGKDLHRRSPPTAPHDKKERPQEEKSGSKGSDNPAFLKTEDH
ncbi:major facilitator superfamily domain-containing protein 6-like [Tachypleus tridentatus]|uniref:major facilitator superfamily domain-containing protein 6-like n=1 Tax=Tachypleus tridentatus TaxID=6853 RepID=UPI003FD1B485